MYQVILLFLIGACAEMSVGRALVDHLASAGESAPKAAFSIGQIDRALTADATGKFRAARYVPKAASKAQSSSMLHQLSSVDRASAADALGKFRGARYVPKSSGEASSSETGSAPPVSARDRTSSKQDDALLSSYVVGKFHPAKYVPQKRRLRVALSERRADYVPSSDSAGRFNSARYVTKLGVVDPTVGELAHKEIRQFVAGQSALSFEMTHKYHGAKYIVRDKEASVGLI
eukprot:TRINITY_DN28079_c0_g1_i1.p1 TRINITY_DN28079_c0_g1~~TRINITY_DN28079_c0_g1_i1.p1  ORF type:complete len:232 (+),score=31.57 TRINITY_DN28079_c0_g1_i1:89-784(+)